MSCGRNDGIVTYCSLLCWIHCSIRLPPPHRSQSILAHGHPSPPWQTIAAGGERRRRRPHRTRSIEMTDDDQTVEQSTETNTNERIVINQVVDLRMSGLAKTISPRPACRILRRGAR
jgi:hypothetical protein